MTNKIRQNAICFQIKQKKTLQKEGVKVCDKIILPQMKEKGKEKWKTCQNLGKREGRRKERRGEKGGE